MDLVSLIDIRKIALSHHPNVVKNLEEYERLNFPLRKSKEDSFESAKNWSFDTAKNWSNETFLKERFFNILFQKATFSQFQNVKK